MALTVGFNDRSTGRNVDIFNSFEASNNTPDPSFEEKFGLPTQADVPTGNMQVNTADGHTAAVNNGQEANAKIGANIGNAQQVKGAYIKQHAQLTAQVNNACNAVMAKENAGSFKTYLAAKSMAPSTSTELGVLTSAVGGKSTIDMLMQYCDDRGPGGDELLQAVLDEMVVQQSQAQRQTEMDTANNNASSLPSKDVDWSKVTLNDLKELLKPVDQHPVVVALDDVINGQKAQKVEKDMAETTTENKTAASKNTGDLGYLMGAAGSLTAEIVKEVAPEPVDNACVLTEVSFMEECLDIKGTETMSGLYDCRIDQSYFNSILGSCGQPAASVVPQLQQAENNMAFTGPKPSQIGEDEQGAWV